MPARLAGAAALALTAAAAQAQQGTPTPTPAPAPSRPPIITLPGAERFELRPSDPQQARPTPAPAPAPTPSRAITPPPIPVATPAARRSEPATRATPAPPRPEAVATPTPTPAPVAEPTAAPLGQPLPTPAATPAPVATAAPLPLPAEEPQPSLLPWLALGAAVPIGLGVAGWLYLTRRRSRRRRGRSYRPVAAPPAPPEPAPLPLQSGPPAALPPLAVAPPSNEPFSIELRPLAIDVSEQGVVLEYELLIGNPSAASAEGVRVSLAMMSANPDQDLLVESFHTAPPVQPIASPFTLLPQAGGRIAGKSLLTHERIHVVRVQGRPMFVPLVMVDVRWRGGLSIRQYGVDYMVGSAGQGGKLGPIWLDRGAQRTVGLAANRYFRKSAVQAAE